MDKTMKNKWLSSLRGNKYQQTQKMLRSKEGGFCCIGVLCDISRKGKWVSIEPHIDNHEQEWSYNIKGKDNYGKIFIQWLYLFDFSDQQQVTLTKMNDSGKSFIEIADWIEENL